MVIFYLILFLVRFQNPPLPHQRDILRPRSIPVLYVRD
jgi:hypothetical protein